MIRINVLPDEVLREIFDLYMMIMKQSYASERSVEAWQSLVHVCRQWRNVVFGSPRRLNLQLYCTDKTPAKDRLDIWPAFPLILSSFTTSGSENVIAALEQSNRVCQVTLYLADRLSEKVFALMQVSFPELTYLYLKLYGGRSPVIPDSFLGGSAPRLRYLRLDNISFPGLPKLLLSATHLVHLILYGIPHSGYISPRAIAALLSALFSLERLFLEFRSPQSRPYREPQGLPPPKRSVLPALHEFRFRGVTEYLEELVTRIDIPQLDCMDITFFNQIDFNCPRLAQFIKCTPIFGALNEAHVRFRNSSASVTLPSRTSESKRRDLQIYISCTELDWQLSSIEQVCNNFLPPLPTVEDLYIWHYYSELVWKDEAIENTLWLQLLLPFTAVKHLYLNKEFAPGIAAAMQELGEGRITEVLPNLQNIFVEGLEPWRSFQKQIGQFVAARQLLGRSIAISIWDDPSFWEHR